MNAQTLIHIVSSIALSILCLSCRNQAEKTDGPFTIDLTRREEAPLMLKDYFTDIEYIPLESNKDCMIGGFAEFFLTDRYIVAISCFADATGRKARV